MKALLKTVGALVAFLFVFGLVVSIINPESMQNQSEESDVAIEEQDQPQPSAAPGVEVTREEYGDRWPFTVDSGRVECRQGGAVVFVVGDWVYQLNGIASQKGYANLAPIWRDNPDIPGSKVSVGPMIRLAQQQC